MLACLHFTLLQDIGQAILESYSRVLESLAYNIVSWIDDVLIADGNARKGHNIRMQKQEFSKLSPQQYWTWWTNIENEFILL